MRYLPIECRRSGGHAPVRLPPADGDANANFTKPHLLDTYRVDEFHGEADHILPGPAFGGGRSKYRAAGKEDRNEGKQARAEGKMKERLHRKRGGDPPKANRREGTGSAPTWGWMSKVVMLLNAKISGGS